jgi:type III secretion protein R
MRSRFFNPKFILCLIAILLVILVSPEQIYSAVANTTPPTTAAAPSASSTLTSAMNIKAPSLISQGVALGLLALMPFIVMMLTSFLKIVVVLSLLRTALGVQQAPPNQVINGIAFMLSLYVMYPTGLKMYDIAQEKSSELHAPQSIISPDSPQYIVALATTVAEPMRDFLKKNSLLAHQILFYRLSYKVLPEQHRADLKPDDIIILIPAFITSQLKDAFEIGVLIYIPFFVIDLVTSNILLAMGMMMLSPVTISMPLKLFLLVMLDGWTTLIQGLVGTFQV